MIQQPNSEIVDDDISSDESLDINNEEFELSSVDLGDDENVSESEDIKNSLSTQNDEDSAILFKNKKNDKSKDVNVTNPPIKKVANIMTKLLSAKEDEESNILSKVYTKIKRESDEEEDEDIPKKKKKKLSKKKKKYVGRIKLDMEDFEKERAFKILATQGVVQLFSTINKHRVDLNKELNKVKGLNQKEKVLAVKGKDYFMNLLKKEGEKLQTENVDNEIKKEEKSYDEDFTPVQLDSESKNTKWSTLAENYYKEPSLAGWDKNDSDDDD